MNRESAGEILTAEQRELLVAVLNRIIPSEAALPGAGGLGLAATVEQAFRGSAVRRLLLDILADITVASPHIPFPLLTEDEQDAALRAVEQARPRAFAALVEQTYCAYYTRPEVHAAIGWDSRPPQPLGHTLPPFDPATLAKQRARPPFWRLTEGV